MRRTGAGPSTPSCLHALGRRLAHTLYHGADLNQLPRLKGTHVLSEAVAMHNRSRRPGADQVGRDLSRTGLTHHQALVLVSSHLQQQVSHGDFSAQTVNKACALMGSFATFMTAGLRRPFVSGTTSSDMGRWINSSTGTGARPSVTVRHARRTSARLFFRVLRHLELCSGDPTLDIVLPARPARGDVRALTDEEVLVARYASCTRRGDTRLPAAQALGEAGAGSGDLARITIENCDLPRS